MNTTGIISDFRRVAQFIGDIKKQEVYLPVANKRIVMHCLKVGDDLALRSSLVSPVTYDKELTKLLFTHSEFVAEDGQAPLKLNYDGLADAISNIDKIVMIWGMYKSTYDTLGERELKCTNESCAHAFKTDITLESLIHEDTFIPWEEEIPFYEFVYPIEIGYSDNQFSYIFESKLPNIKDSNRILGKISIDAIQKNMQQTGQVFTKSEQIASLCKAISIRANANGEEVRTDNLDDILLVLKNDIPKIVSEEFFRKYNKKFQKYNPNFYTVSKCPQCETEIKYIVDLEIEFFRRSLSEGWEGEQ